MIRLTTEVHHKEKQYFSLYYVKISYSIAKEYKYALCVFILINYSKSVRFRCHLCQRESENLPEIVQHAVDVHHLEQLIIRHIFFRRKQWKVLESILWLFFQGICLISSPRGSGHIVEGLTDSQFCCTKFSSIIWQHYVSSSFYATQHY